MARALSTLLLPVSFSVAAADSVTVVQAEMPLTAVGFTSYPEYQGQLAVSGTVSVGRSQIGTQVLFFDLLGTDELCSTNDPGDMANACGIHVHTGSSCDHAGETYYNSATLTADPWLDVTYATVGGKASGHNERVTTGATLADLQNRTVVVYDHIGNRVACAPLVQVNATGLALVPGVAKYPDYNDSLVVNGTVEVAQAGVGLAAAQIFRFNLTGVDPQCTAPVADVPNSCGIHIHAGTTCSDATQVGGHYYDSAHIASDPWAPIQYVADGSAAAVGVTTPVVTGEALSSVVGKAFVVHDVTGARIGCALIQAAPAPKDSSGAIVALAGAGPSPRWWALAAATVVMRAVL